MFSIALRYDPCDVWLDPPPDEESPVLTTTICPTEEEGICWVSNETEFFTPGELFNDDILVEKLKRRNY